MSIRTRAGSCAARCRTVFVNSWTASITEPRGPTSASVCSPTTLATTTSSSISVSTRPSSPIASSSPSRNSRTSGSCSAGGRSLRGSFSFRVSCGCLLRGASLPASERMFLAFPSPGRAGRGDPFALAASGWRPPRFFFLPRLRLRPAGFSVTLTMASRAPIPKNPRSGSCRTSISRRSRSVTPSSRIAASIAISIVFAFTSTYATSAPSAPTLLLRARLRLLAVTFSGLGRLGRCRLVTVGRGRGGPAVDLEDHDLLAEPEEIAGGPVEDQTCRESPGDEADEEGHDLRHSLLGTRLGSFRLGLPVGGMPGLYVLGSHHQNDHEQVGESGHQALGEGLGRRPRQVHSQELGVPLGHGLPQSRSVGQPTENPRHHIADTHSGLEPLHLGEDRLRHLRQAQDPEERIPDRHLDEKGDQTPAGRGTGFFLDPHQLPLHLLGTVLVLLLDAFDLGLDRLERPRGPGLFQCQREEGQVDEDREHHDPQTERGDDPIDEVEEEGQRLLDGIEDRTHQSCPPRGTGSNPPAWNG